MFGSSNNQGSKNQPATNNKQRKPVTAKDAAVTILTSGCHFNGKLFCRGSSRIGGRIEGQIVSEGLLIVEEEAQIQAEVKADEAIIQGRVNGKLEAKIRVELCASSRFDGDILTPVLVVHEGAQFNGRSTMVASATVDEKRPRNVKILHSERGSHDADLKGRHDDRPDVAVMSVADPLIPSLT